MDGQGCPPSGVPAGLGLSRPELRLRALMGLVASSSSSELSSTTTAGLEALRFFLLVPASVGAVPGATISLENKAGAAAE